MLRKPGLIIILIFAAFAATGCSHNRDVTSGLSENEAQRICVLLNQNGLNASKVKAGAEDNITWSVQVETPFIVGDKAIAAAQYILSENDLPRSRENPYKSAFNAGGLIPTQTEESLRKLAAIQEAVELTLEKVSGVVSVKVNLVLPNPNPLVEASKQTQASASVLLKYNSKEPPLTAEEVSRLVAPAVEGLETAKVQVVMKAVPPPDVAKFDDIKNYFIRIIGLSGVALVGILLGSLIFCIFRMRKLSETILQLERQASRAVAKKEQNQPVPAATPAAR